MNANIHRSRIHEDMVQKISMHKLDGAERSLFPTIRELLCFAALLGYSEQRRIPLDRTAGVEDISSEQFRRGDAEDLIYMLALAETRNPEILKDGMEEECAKIFEEYANGGLSVLRELLLRTGGEYPDRAIQDFLMTSGYLSYHNNDDDDPAGITF